LRGGHWLRLSQCLATVAVAALDSYDKQLLFVRNHVKRHMAVSNLECLYCTVLYCNVRKGTGEEEVGRSYCPVPSTCRSSR